MGNYTVGIVGSISPSTVHMTPINPSGMSSGRTLDHPHYGRIHTRHRLTFQTITIKPQHVNGRMSGATLRYRGRGRPGFHLLEYVMGH